MTAGFSVRKTQATTVQAHAGTPGRRASVDRSGSVGGSDVLVQPLSEWGGGPKNLGDPALGRSRGEPCSHRPLLPSGEALVSEELDSRVVAGVTPWRRLQGLTGGHPDAFRTEIFHQSDELRTSSLIGNRSPKAR